jgi:MYXO-CTERM domain-containing protein
LARVGYDDAWETFPFLGTHLYNPKALGSLPWLGDNVAVYWDVLLRRIHGTDDIDQDLIVRTIPEDGATNFAVSTEESAAYGRMGLVFGYGILKDEVTSHISLKDPDDNVVPLLFGTPYGTNDCQFVYFWSETPLEYNTTYTVEVSPGVTPMHGGAATTETFSYSFQTLSADDALADCPPLDPPLVAGPKPVHPKPDAGGDADAGVQPEPDAGAEEPPSTGGGCAISGADGGAPSWLAFALALSFVFVRRRRRGA